MKYYYKHDCNRQAWNKGSLVDPARKHSLNSRTPIAIYTPSIKNHGVPRKPHETNMESLFGLRVWISFQ